MADQEKQFEGVSTATLEAELRRRKASPQCTGIAAVWCPVCGTCQCPDRMDLNDDNCPLHNVASLHAELSYD